MHILHSLFQPKIQKDLLQQERSFAMWAEAMLNSERMCECISHRIERTVRGTCTYILFIIPVIPQKRGSEN